MARVRMKWFGAKLQKDVKQEMLRRLAQVGEIVASEVRKNISESTRSGGPSIAGEFPHADTGFLRKSIVSEVLPDRMTVRVGTPVIYGKYLEEGTENMEARPFLIRTAREMQPRIKSILSRPMKGGAASAGKLGVK